MDVAPVVGSGGKVRARVVLEEASIGWVRHEETREMSQVYECMGTRQDSEHVECLGVKGIVLAGCLHL